MSPIFRVARDLSIGGDGPALVWVRIVPRDGHATLERTDWLTPYTAEQIAEDALRAGPGARLEMAADMTQGELADVLNRFAWLGKRGIEVEVRPLQTA